MPSLRACLIFTKFLPQGFSLQPLRVTMLQADAVFLSPPWGGPDYNARSDFDVSQDFGSLGANYLELMHISNSALHQPLTNLAPLQSFDSDITQQKLDVSEGQFPVTAAQLVLPCNLDRAESSGRIAPPTEGDPAENAAVLDSRERSQGECPEDDSAHTLRQLSQQRLLDLADQTLAALNASGRTSEATADTSQTKEGSNENKVAALSDATEQIGPGISSSAYPALAHEVGHEQELAGTESMNLQNIMLEGQTPNQAISERPCSAPAHSQQYPDSREEAYLPSSSGILQTKGIACFLPKSTNLTQLSAAVAEGSFCEVERNVLNGRLKSVTVYHGPCAVRC